MPFYILISNFLEIDFNKEKSLLFVNFLQLFYHLCYIFYCFLVIIWYFLN